MQRRGMSSVRLDGDRMECRREERSLLYRQGYQIYDDLVYDKDAFVSRPVVLNLH